MWDLEWVSQYQRVTFSTGQSVFSVDDNYSNNYYLLDGMCAKCHITDDGDRVTLNYYRNGRMLGYHMRHVNISGDCEFIAKSRCICYRIPFVDVDEYVKQHAHLSYSLMLEAVAEIDFWISSYIALSMGGGISILCLALHGLAERQEDGTYLIPAVFTNVELSQYCGLHAVSISRFLNILIKDQVIERTKNGLKLANADMLLAYVKAVSV